MREKINNACFVITQKNNIKTIAAGTDDNIYALAVGSGASSLYKITNGVAELKKADLPTGASSVYVSRSSSPISS